MVCLRWRAKSGKLRAWSLWKGDSPQNGVSTLKSGVLGSLGHSKQEGIFSCTAFPWGQTVENVAQENVRSWTVSFLFLNRLLELALEKVADHGPPKPKKNKTKISKKYAEEEK